MLPFGVLKLRTQHLLFCVLLAAGFVEVIYLRVHVALDHEVVLTAVEAKYLLGDFNDDHQIVKPGNTSSMFAWRRITLMKLD